MRTKGINYVVALGRVVGGRSRSREGAVAI